MNHLRCRESGPRVAVIVLCYLANVSPHPINSSCKKTSYAVRYVPSNLRDTKVLFISLILQKDNVSYYIYLIIDVW